MVAKLLIIDDEADFVKVIRRLLRSCTFLEVLGVNGLNPCREAIELLDREPDLSIFYVLVDLHMKDYVTDLINDDAGDVFVNNIISQECYITKGLQISQIAIFSCFADLNSTALSTSLGVRRVWKLHLSEFLLSDLVPKIKADYESKS